MKWFVLILACAVLLGACATDDSQAGPAPTTDDFAPSDGETAPAKDIMAEDQAASDDVGDKLMKFFKEEGRLEWKIAYDITTTAEGETFNGKMTQYMKGEEKLRTDMTASGVESQMYFVDGTVTMCTKMNSAWSCFKSTPEEQEDKTKELESDFEENPDDYEIVPDGNKKVAGYDTECYKMTHAASKSTVRYCFSQDALPLYIKADYEGTTSEMTATSVSRTVSNTEFTPPVEAKDMGAAGGTSPAGGDACAYCDYLSGEQKEQCLASC